MNHTNEKAVAGKTNGLIELGETVTWEAVHFGIRQTLTSKITAYHWPNHFRDEQLQGPFKFIVHDHYFEQRGDTVVMKDSFSFDSPFGFLGKLANPTLTKYLTRLLSQRNDVIKEYAESGKWKLIIHPQQK